EKLTKGLGVGGDHTMGQKAAEESRDELKELVSGADMVFITAAWVVAPAPGLPLSLLKQLSRMEPSLLP
ncbi:unnamed protein product, partial [marine sediment metagenome]